MVAAGTLVPGTQLPTIRQLATDLGLAKGTVNKAYDELLRAGVAVSDGRRGTRIALRPRDRPKSERARVGRRRGTFRGRRAPVGRWRPAGESRGRRGPARYPILAVDLSRNRPQDSGERGKAPVVSSCVEREGERQLFPIFPRWTVRWGSRSLRCSCSTAVTCSADTSALTSSLRSRGS